MSEQYITETKGQLTMIRNYFNNRYFGAVIKGTNKTKDGNERLWTAIGNGWYRIITNKGKSDETHIWVTDAEAKGELRWLNIATFTGEVVSFQGERVIYFSGKIINKETFTFPKLPDYKAILAKYKGETVQEESLSTIPTTYEEVITKREEYLHKLMPKVFPTVTAKLTADVSNVCTQKFPSVTAKVSK